MVSRMNTRLSHGLLAAAVLACGMAGHPAAAADEPYQEVQHRESWLASLFLRPAKDTPAAQLAYARLLRDRGSLRRAKSHYHALVATWPATPEAATAQYEWARILEAQKDYSGAFEQYQVLINRFPGRFDFTEVIGRQAALAERVATHRSLPFLFGGFTSPDRAVPMLEQILTNAPAWSGAAEARFRIGDIYEAEGTHNSLFEAAAAFANVTYLHPDSPWAEKAAARRVECLVRASAKAPNNSRILDDAWASAIDYLARYPASERAPLITLRRDALFRRRAEAAYKAAHYYDRQKRSPDVVRAAYEHFLSQFPNSPWTAAAQRRIAELAPAKETTP